MADLILPVLNEAGALPRVLEAVPAGWDPIVVDNGSTDDSAGLARRLGARVVSEPRRGFGAACAAGLGAATAEVVCFMDCDGSLDPREVQAVAGPVASGEADLVLGRRLAEPGAWPLHARVANRLLAAEIRRRSGVSLGDLGPMRAARRDRLRALGIRDRRFGWPLEMVILAAAEGWRIGEVPVRYLPREGHSKVTGTVRGTARTLIDMSRVLRETSSSDRAANPSGGA
jgi:glycosyltransferase involved in cell wall biosynthesis